MYCNRALQGLSCAIREIAVRKTAKTVLMKTPPALEATNYRRRAQRITSLIFRLAAAACDDCFAAPAAEGWRDSEQGRIDRFQDVDQTAGPRPLEVSAEKALAHRQQV